MKKGARTDLATLTMPFSVALSVLNTGVRRLMYLTFRCLGSGQSLASRQILSTNSPGCTGSIVFMKKRHSRTADTGEKICLTLGLLSSPLMASRGRVRARVRRIDSSTAVSASVTGVLSGLALTLRSSALKRLMESESASSAIRWASSGSPGGSGEREVFLFRAPGQTSPISVSGAASDKQLRDLVTPELARATSKGGQHWQAVTWRVGDRDEPAVMVGQDVSVPLVGTWQLFFLYSMQPEQDRLDLAHAMTTKLTGDRLHLTPLPEDFAGRVLDIGCGTGIWSICMGDQFPNAQILGNDLSPVQPSWVCAFEKLEAGQLNCAKGGRRGEEAVRGSAAACDTGCGG